MTTDYGRDTWCDDSLHPGRYATGPKLVALRCYRRLITPRGTMGAVWGEEEENFGFDVAGKLGSIVTPDEVAATPGQIDNELRKDPEVLEVDTEITSTTDSAGAVSAEIAIDGVTAEGPFELVMAITGNVSEIVRLTAGGA